MYWMRRKTAGDSAAAKIDFPWFLIGFIAMSILGSYVLGHSIPVSEGVMEMTSTVTTWLITAAMVGLGLNVSLGDVRTKALKPLIAMVITSIVLSVLTFLIV